MDIDQVWIDVNDEEDKLDIMKELHGGKFGGHLGYKKTYNKIRSRFYWPGMREDIKSFCQSCESCIKNKAGQPKHTKMTSIIAESPSVALHIGCY